MTKATQNVPFITAHQALIQHAELRARDTFLHQPIDGNVTAISYADTVSMTRRMAQALLNLGLRKGSHVALFGKNSAEWFIADMAIAMAGMISVPIYPNASKSTVTFVLQHSKAEACFVGKNDDANIMQTINEQIKNAIGFPYDGIECALSWQQLLDESEELQNVVEPAAHEPMTILYTSGSTGQPKGVVLSFGAYAHSCKCVIGITDMSPEDRLVSYLPLAHITERACIAGPAIYSGAKVWFTESLETFAKDLQRAQPTFFLSVPRLWHKFQSVIHEKLPPSKLQTLLKIPVIGYFIKQKIKKGLGFSSCHQYGSGSASIPPELIDWYEGLGIRIGEGWGMSETGGVSCANIPVSVKKMGTIGLPLEGTEFRISEAGELLIKSPTLFTEYYKDPELTRQSFTEDGFFRTGDQAEWIEDCDAYRITGRVKDLFKTAKGKYVAPMPIESALTADSSVELACVMGSGLPQPVAVVNLSPHAQSEAQEQTSESLDSLLQKVNRSLESHQRLSTIIIANEEWSPDNGLLTPTLKIRRNQLESYYQDLITKPAGQSVYFQ